MFVSKLIGQKSPIRLTPQVPIYNSNTIYTKTKQKPGKC